MDEDTELQLDQALARLVRDVRTGTPAPGPDLVARVLADAGAALPPPRQMPARAPVAARRGLADWLLGWTGGAVAALGICLALGIGIGMTIEPADLPVFGAEPVDIAFMTADTISAEDIL